MAAEKLRDSLRDLHAAQDRHRDVLALVKELDKQIEENDFYHPPPRPTV